MIEAWATMQQEHFCLAAAYSLRPYFVFAIDHWDPADTCCSASWIERVAHVDEDGG